VKQFVKNIRRGEGEIEIYKIFNSIAPKYNKTFSKLVLPQAIRIDVKNKKITLPYYDGETFNKTWDESNGGKPLGLDLSKEIPLLLSDLSKVDNSYLTSNKILSSIPKLAFEHEEAISYFGEIAAKFRQRGVITQEDYQKIIRLLNFRQTSKKIFNNGDFYPRNFIRRSDGRIILIDWETWNSGSPFYVIDHLENVAAVAFIHMWGNPEWQKAYVNELKHTFSLDEQSFNKGIVMKSLELGDFWFKQ
jgi:hypothetical protein